MRTVSGRVRFGVEVRSYAPPLQPTQRATRRVGRQAHPREWHADCRQYAADGSAVPCTTRSPGRSGVMTPPMRAPPWPPPGPPPAPPPPPGGAPPPPAPPAGRTRPAPGAPTGASPTAAPATPPTGPAHPNVDRPDWAVP